MNDLAAASLPTVTVPFMNSACGWQKYWYLPGFVNLWAKVPPASSSGDSHFSGCPGLLVAVCADGPVKFQVTVSPTSIEMLFGVNS